ncbi:MAG: RES family NAD+ phosphorylase [Planctomycetota bacterium]
MAGVAPPVAAQRIGDAWLAGATSAVLQVASALVPMDWNYLLNPAHPDFRRITIGSATPISLDPRLVKTPPP